LTGIPEIAKQSGRGCGELCHHRSTWVPHRVFLLFYPLQHLDHKAIQKGMERRSMIAHPHKSANGKSGEV